MGGMNWDRVRREERAGHRLDVPTQQATPIRRKPAKKKPKNSSNGYRQCAATTKNGARCKGGAMRGTSYCGPHQQHQGHRCHLCDNKITPSGAPGRRPLTWRDDDGLHHAHPECAKSWMTSTPSRGGDEPRAVEET